MQNEKSQAQVLPMATISIKNVKHVASTVRPTDRVHCQPDATLVQISTQLENDYVGNVFDSTRRTKNVSTIDITTGKSFEQHHETSKDSSSDSNLYVQSHVEDSNIFEQTQNNSIEYDTDDSENSFFTANDPVD